MVNEIIQFNGGYADLFNILLSNYFVARSAISPRECNGFMLPQMSILCVKMKNYKLNGFELNAANKSKSKWPYTTQHNKKQHNPILVQKLNIHRREWEDWLVYRFIKLQEREKRDIRRKK